MPGCLTMPSAPLPGMRYTRRTGCSSHPCERGRYQPFPALSPVQPVYDLLLSKWRHQVWWYRERGSDKPPLQRTDSGVSTCVWDEGTRFPHLTFSTHAFRTANSKWRVPRGTRGSPKAALETPACLGRRAQAHTIIVNNRASTYPEAEIMQVITPYVHPVTPVLLPPLGRPAHQ